MNYVTTDPVLFEGQAHLTGRRITVQEIAEHHLHFNWTAEQIAKAFQLSMAAVHAALSYYYDHQTEIDASIRVDQTAGASAPSLQDAINRTLPLLITPQEAADELLITYKGVAKAIDAGQIRARRFGSTWLMLRRDAERLWNRRFKARE